MPKTHNNLYSRIVDFDNLWQAYLSARKGKRYRKEVAEFTMRLEENLMNIHNHLVWQTWQPGKARNFRIFEPKQRDIQAPPFADRIVHHALVRVVEPLFEKGFIYHSYACRNGKGAQRAVKALQQMLRQAERNHANPYVIKADIKSYFASINHEALFKEIERVVSCKQTIALWKNIASAYGHEEGTGLPVGALTSQLSANIMLNRVDHDLTDNSGIRGYIRYMDDTIMIASNKREAHDRLQQMVVSVADKELRMNPKTKVFPCKSGVDFCGYRAWSTHILPRKRNMLRARKGLARAVKLDDSKQLSMQVSSFIAYTKHCSAHRSTMYALREINYQGGLLCRSLTTF
jgi:retron-type reverse transcriptase